MTKGQLVELIISDVAGGAIPSDLDSRYHPLVIEKYIDLVYSGILNQVSMNSIIYRDWGQLDQYCKAYKNVSCSKDYDRMEWYSELPAKIIELTKNRGIRLISPMQNQADKFKYRDNSSEDVWSALESQNVVGYTNFYREGGRVFYGNFKEDYATEGLLFKLLVPMSEFDDDDEIGLPAAKSLEFVGMVRDMLLRRPPEDVAEDNNSKQV